MNGERFDYTAYEDGTESIYDRKEDEYYFDGQMSKIEELMNELAEENELLKEIINELFNTITELDWVKKEYCNALFRILGEENDVDKAKQRIWEFLE